MRKSAFRLSILYALIYLLFYVFTVSKWSHLDPLSTIFCLGTSGFISVLCLGILYLKKNNDPQADTFRLLIMITVQLLSYLSVCLALIYSNQSNTMVLHLLGLALILIFAQTIFIVHRLKTTNEF